MPENFYRILGIASDASPKAVKEAYRRLAKTFHPDHYGSDDKPFKAIQEAYTVLSDPIRRRCHDGRLRESVYDRTTPAGPGRNAEKIRTMNGVEPLIPEPEAVSRSRYEFQVSMDDLIREIFRCLGNRAEPRREKQERRYGTLHIRIK